MAPFSRALSVLSVVVVLAACSTGGGGNSGADKAAVQPITAKLPGHHPGRISVCNEAGGPALRVMVFGASVANAQQLSPSDLIAFRTRLVHAGHALAVLQRPSGRSTPSRILRRVQADLAVVRHDQLGSAGLFVHARRLTDAARDLARVCGQLH